MHLRDMADSWRNHDHANIPTYVIEGGVTVSVLASSTAICIFCTQSIWVIWPKLCSGLLFIINVGMFGAYGIYVVRMAV